MDLLDRLRIDVPVAQAGMGGGLAGAELAGAVAAAGGLGTLGLASASELRRAIRDVRERAPGRAVAVNLLMRYVRRSHVEECVRARIDVAVVAFGIDRAMIRHLSEAGVFVFVMVGDESHAREALAFGADGLIAQGQESGGHLSGAVDGDALLPNVLDVAAGRPVLRAGGIATGADTQAALAAGAAGALAGTRFLMTHESRAHRSYLDRLTLSDTTFRTTLFGLSWPAPHRVIANAATRRWCGSDGQARVAPRTVNALSGPLARLPERRAAATVGLQRSALPLFTPAVPTIDMPESAVDTMALYAGRSVARITSVISAKEAVAALAPGGQ
jgi:NAD(P)H-dependent flavin oxidoreductase YrpB (nitropropane dioxygenase family)